MNRKTLTALAAFVVLGIVAFVALRQPEKGERQQRARPIAKITPGDVDTLEVTRGGATTVIKKQGGKYQVTSPTAYAADEIAAKSAFEAVEKLELNDLVTDAKGKQAEFEVDDAKGVRVVARKGAGAGAAVLADVVVGKSAGAGTMVRLSGKDEVWQAEGNIRFTFDKPPADWRDKSVTTYTAADAETITVKAKDGSSIALKKNGKAGSDDKWEVTASSLKIDKLDNNIPNGVAQALAALKASDFVDAAAPDAGLDAPALTVTVGLKGGKSATVLVGNKKSEDDTYLKRGDAPQVFLAKKYALERVNKRPIEFRDKTLCDLADTDLTEVAVTNTDKSFTVVKSGADWKATKPAKLEIDTSKVTPIATAFKDWKAAAFAEDPSPKATGLVKPRSVIVAKSKKGSCTIKLGDETKDKQNYFVQTAKGPEVYIVAKWSADRILIKPDDLKKK